MLRLFIMTSSSRMISYGLDGVWFWRASSLTTHNPNKYLSWSIYLSSLSISSRFESTETYMKIRSLERLPANTFRSYHYGKTSKEKLMYFTLERKLIKRQQSLNEAIFWIWKFSSSKEFDKFLILMNLN